MQTEIRSLGASGEGVGQTSEGKTLFIEGALPSEEVSYTIDIEKKSYAKGKLLKIIKPSKVRVKPPCPVFDRCGGCQIQHLSYEGQLEVKRQRVLDALQRIGKIDAQVAPCIPSPTPFHYRNKIQLPHKHGLIGLYQKNSHEIVPIDSCPIQCEKGNEIFAFLKNKLPPSIKHLLIRNALFTNEALVVFVAQKEEKTLALLAQELLDHFDEVKGVVLNINPSTSNRILGPKFKTLAGSSTITEKLGTLFFKLSAPSFFQVNSKQAVNLFEHAVHNIDNDYVIDAFCGVGTLSLFAAKKAKSVLGIECVKEAIADAKSNAKLNSIENCHFEVGRAEDSPLRCDTLLLNPPRKGLEPKIFNKIEAKKIVYISCDPATLARDLSYLKQYQIDSIQPFDMFPQTMHIETVVRMHLKSEV